MTFSLDDVKNLKISIGNVISIVVFCAGIITYVNTTYALKSDIIKLETKIAEQEHEIYRQQGQISAYLANEIERTRKVVANVANNQKKSDITISRVSNLIEGPMLGSSPNEIPQK